MPDPLSHHPTMLRIDDTLPPLWWLNPWGLCRSLHKAVRAMQALAHQDDEDNARLTARVRELESGLDRLHAAIITGGAIVPDAQPEEEPSK